MNEQMRVGLTKGTEGGAVKDGAAVDWSSDISRLEARLAELRRMAAQGTSNVRDGHANKPDHHSSAANGSRQASMLENLAYGMTVPGQPRPKRTSGRGVRSGYAYRTEFGSDLFPDSGRNRQEQRGK